MKELLDKLLNQNGTSLEKLNTFEEIPDLRNLQKYKNIIKKIKEHYKSNYKIFLCGDNFSDLDGVTSAAIFYMFLTKILNFNENQIVVYYEQEKNHNISNEMLHQMDLENDLLICLDMGTNNVDKWYKVKNIIIIDHHPFNHSHKNQFLLNNHEEPTLSNELTGASLAYLIVKTYLKENKLQTKLNKYDDYLHSLAILGTIADSAKLLDEQVKSLCIKDFYLVNKEYQLYRTFNEYTKTVYDLQFASIIPAINAILRIGNYQSKRIVFDSMICKNETFTVEVRRLNKETRKYEIKIEDMDIFQYIHYISSKYKTQQTSKMNSIKKEIEESGSNGLHIVKCEDSVSNLSGVIAGSLGFSLVGSETVDGYIKGSLRGFEIDSLSLKKMCEESGLFESLVGHENACGFLIKKENVKAFQRYYNTVLQPLITKNKNEQEIDYEFNNKLPLKLLKIHEIYGLELSIVKRHWLFKIKNFKYNLKNVDSKKTTTYFNENGITIVKFKDEEFYNTLLNNLDKELDITGRFIKTFSGHYQFMITNFEFKEENIFDF